MSEERLNQTTTMDNVVPNESPTAEKLVNPPRVPSAYPGKHSKAMSSGAPSAVKKAGSKGGSKAGGPAKKAPSKKANKRDRVVLSHRWARYAIQLVFFIMAPALFSGAFNGVKYLCTQVGLGDAIEPTSFLVQLIAVLAFTILFGRFFCGYACAFGTLGDYLYNACEFIRRRTPIPRPKLPEKFVRVASLLKYVVLAAICLACFVGVWASYSSDSPWVAFAAILAGSLDGIGPVAIGLLIAVVVGMILRERFFCQFLCPLGAVFSLMPVLGFSQFVRKRAHCAKKCGRCQFVCPVDIWPDGDSINQGECISCGRCADVCPMNNVNMVAIEKAEAKAARLAAEEAAAKKAEAAIAAETEAEAAPKVDKTQAATIQQQASRPLRKKAEEWHLLRGTELGYVIAKAVLLLIVCWLVGAARYVPSFMDVFGFNPFMF